MRVKYIFLFVLAIVYTNASAQDVTKQEIENNYVIASDNIGFNKYDKAIPALHWLLKNAPSFSESVQNDAIQVFETKANEVSDYTQKAMFLDSMLIAFESKREYFGLDAQDKNKLAFRYYKYFRKDDQKVKAGYQAFIEAFEATEKVFNNNLVPYLYMAKRYNDVVQEISKAEADKIYDQIKFVVDARKSNNKDAKRLERYMSTIDGLYVGLLGDNISCETMTRLDDGLNRSDSVKVSKRLMSLTLEAKCGRTDIYQQAIELLARNEPNSGLFKVLAQYEASDKQYTKAINLYEKAYALEDDDTKKASIHFDIANLHYANMNKSAAREYALSSIQLDQEQSASAYSLIGKMYMTSYNECAEGNNPVEDRAVFFAAYDMFEKAKDGAGMEEALAQFPTKSVAFDYDLYEGDAIELGCWINVKTKIRTRSIN